MTDERLARIQSLIEFQITDCKRDRDFGNRRKHEAEKIAWLRKVKKQMNQIYAEATK